MAWDECNHPPRKPPIGFFCTWTAPILGVASFLKARLVDKKRLGCEYRGKFRATERRRIEDAMDIMRGDIRPLLNLVKG